jgi:transcriptional regulator with XRE-family HTH domain
MKKTTAFKKLIKNNRKLLITKGFKASTVSMWEHGNRRPEIPMAKKIAKVLNVPLSDIPYLQRAVYND